MIRSLRRLLALLLLVSLVTASCALVQPMQRGVPADQQAVIDAVQALFDAMHAADADAAREQLTADGTFASLRQTEAGEQVRIHDHAEFLSSLAAAGEGAWLERMWQPQVEIRGPLAVLWAKYDFHHAAGGEFSHCGEEAFSLIRQDGRWRIAGSIYTVRQQGGGL